MTKHPGPTILTYSAIVTFVLGLAGFALNMSGEDYNPVAQVILTFCFLLWLPLLIASLIWRAAIRDTAAMSRPKEVGLIRRRLPAILSAVSLLMLAIVYLIQASKLYESEFFLIVAAILGLLLPPTIIAAVVLAIYRRRGK